MRKSSSVVTAVLSSRGNQNRPLCHSLCIKAKISQDIQFAMLLPHPRPLPFWGVSFRKSSPSPAFCPDSSAQWCQFSLDEELKLSIRESERDPQPRKHAFFFSSSSFLFLHFVYASVDLKGPQKWDDIFATFSASFSFRPWHASCPTPAPNEGTHYSSDAPVT